MPEHKVGTREEWEAARAELSKLEGEQAERNNEIKEQRQALPWVPVEKEYEFDTQEGKKSLAELFDGRSQLLAYNIMYGPDYEVGACPGCTSLADGLNGSLDQINELPGVSTSNAAKNNRIYRIEEHELMYFGPRSGENVEKVAAVIHQK